MNAEEYDALYEHMLRLQAEVDALDRQRSKRWAELESVKQRLGLRTSLNELDLGVRTYNLLKTKGFSDVASILSMLYHGGVPALMQIRGFGPKAWEELAERLVQRQVLTQEQVDHLNTQYRASLTGDQAK